MCISGSLRRFASHLRFGGGLPSTNTESHHAPPLSDPLNVNSSEPVIEITLLTGGSDRPYVFGLTTQLLAKGVSLDLLGSDELTIPQLTNAKGLQFLNLRNELPSDAAPTRKAYRLVRCYAKLIAYAATSEPHLFHILWNNKLEYVDRTILMAYYRLLGKKIVITAHNVNAARRDHNDSWLNRATLRLQYRMSHRIFVHTPAMKVELQNEFGVPGDRIVVIPFGINNFAPNSSMTSGDAKRRLGIDTGERTILSFGRITPYKGYECLIEAYRIAQRQNDKHRLIIAGRVDRCESYWARIKADLREEIKQGTVIVKDEHIPDEDTELYFKAADVLVLPYKHIYQSGVLFLGQSFGLPALAADVGSFRDEIEEGCNGFIFKPEDPKDMARAIEEYFSSALYRNLDQKRPEIKEDCRRRHSWDVVGELTLKVYADLLSVELPRNCPESDIKRSHISANS